MTLPSLEDLDGLLDRACVEVLGDTISYRAVGLASYRSVKAHVDYQEAVRSIDNGQVLEQDITVQVLIADVPVRPGAGVRLQLPRVAGLTYKPVNVRRDQSGSHWVFELAQVNA